MAEQATSKLLVCVSTPARRVSKQATALLALPSQQVGAILGKLHKHERVDALGVVLCTRAPKVGVPAEDIPQVLLRNSLGRWRALGLLQHIAPGAAMTTASLGTTRGRAATAAGSSASTGATALSTVDGDGEGSLVLRLCALQLCHKRAGAGVTWGQASQLVLLAAQLAVCGASDECVYRVPHHIVPLP